MGRARKCRPMGAGSSERGARKDDRPARRRTACGCSYTTRAVESSSLSPGDRLLSLRICGNYSLPPALIRPRGWRGYMAALEDPKNTTGCVRSTYTQLVTFLFARSGIILHRVHVLLLKNCMFSTTSRALFGWLMVMNTPCPSVKLLQRERGSLNILVPPQPACKSELGLHLAQYRLGFVLGRSVSPTSVRRPGLACVQLENSPTQPISSIFFGQAH